MADFYKAIDFVLGNEGGFVNDPGDAGGATNFGISQRAYPNEDIKNLTREQAVDIYHADYWRFDLFDDQRVATKVFDASVNLGMSKAVRLLQLSLGSLQAGPVVADGKLSQQTTDAVNAADSEKLVDEFKARLCKYYCDLNKPEFTMGWLRRAVKG